MRILLGIGIFLAILTTSEAYDFKNFKLTNQLKKLNHHNKGFSSIEDNSLLRAEINGLLLTEARNNQKSNDEHYSSIFEKILEVMGNNYESIGNANAGPLIANHQLGGGVVNFSGFTWQKPFANFKLHANRELAPDLYSDRWIVHDTITIVITASTLLTNMRDLDLVDIDDEGIAAFAGVGFARTYHYYHFADSYLDGLKADYSKLFLSFTKFTSNSALNLPLYHILKREDFFTFNAGGFLNSPSWYGVSGKAGVIVSNSFTNILTLQSLGPADSPKKGEFLRVSVESEKEKSTDVNISLQLDFFNLLKLTLLSYDLEYSLEKSEKIYLSFFDQDREILTTDAKFKFGDLINGSSENVDYFRKNIVQKDVRFKENLNSKFNFLLLGSIKKTATEQIQIVKDGIEKVFFKHYAESKKIIQSFWSKVLGVVIQKIFDFNSGVKNAAESSKTMNLEYEVIASLGDAEVEKEEQFSVKLTQNFFADKTNGFWKRFYRKEAVKHVARYTDFDENIRKMIDNSTIRGPLTITTNVMLEESALKFFNEQESASVLSSIKQVCEKSKFCYKFLSESYLDYKEKLEKTGVIDLMKFKLFIGRYYKEIRSNYDFYLLFGSQNVFIGGSINAVTSKGLPFQNFFKTGQFKGLGVIDDFMRSGQGQVVLPVEMN